MSDAYTVQDGGTDLPRGAVHMPATIGWCELCAAYRRSPVWHTMRHRGTPYVACHRHTPMERALWETAQTV